MKWISCLAVAGCLASGCVKTVAGAAKVTHANAIAYVGDTKTAVAAYDDAVNKCVDASAKHAAAQNAHASDVALWQGATGMVGVVTTATGAVLALAAQAQPESEKSTRAALGTSAAIVLAAGGIASTLSASALTVVGLDDVRAGEYARYKVYEDKRADAETQFGQLDMRLRSTSGDERDAANAELSVLTGFVERGCISPAP